MFHDDVGFVEVIGLIITGECACIISLYIPISIIITINITITIRIHTIVSVSVSVTNCSIIRTCIVIVVVIVIGSTCTIPFQCLQVVIPINFLPNRFQIHDKEPLLTRIGVAPNGPNWTPARCGVLSRNSNIHIHCLSTG